MISAGNAVTQDSSSKNSGNRISLMLKHGRITKACSADTWRLLVHVDNRRWLKTAIAPVNNEINRMFKRLAHIIRIRQRHIITGENQRTAHQWFAESIQEVMKMDFEADEDWEDEV